MKERVSLAGMEYNHDELWISTVTKVLNATEGEH
jgi:hypothetical protein